ncbi:unnamed protein product [Mytilus edulis]|uniref:Uncharacterized protein n=1 Tax=Mytilus edulis TaxID=6550 RepID=A0A8S3T583_MYTED|nr:unnamed protein product [Mytilus edulis]
MHQPSNGSSTQEEYSREQCINHQMGLQHRRIQQGTMHQPSNESSTQENTAGTMHQPSNETQGEYSREQCINHQMSLQHRKNTAGLASTIKWGEYSRNNASTIKSNRRIHQNNASTIKWSSTQSSTQGEYSREQCINHQMSLQHRRIQQGTMHQPSKWVFNHQMGIQQGTMHQPSNGSSTQENTAGNNAPTIKYHKIRRIQGTMHQPSNGSSTQENMQGNKLIIQTIK